MPAWLKQVVDEKGWPTRSMVGSDGASAASYIAQHAKLDLGFPGEGVGTAAGRGESGRGGFWPVRHAQGPGVAPTGQAAGLRHPVPGTTRTTAYRFSRPGT